ncbi:MAG: peptide-methionine (R)-S-oxide reductase MsrB [Ahrensia sp.]|nr:peptide-methionine (R)-S-oxide reductase MsrB [Ahrensia sp.]
MNRRSFVVASLFGTAAIGIISFPAYRGHLSSSSSHTNPADGNFEVVFSEAEWRERLSPTQFEVLRKEATEQPFSSPLLQESRAGKYHCGGCDLASYSSDKKFDSKTGWPSFYDALPNSVRTKEDNSLFATRTEVHCRRCGGHFGHIFDDGPAPTGLRHCLNGSAFTFRPSNQT